MTTRMETNDCALAAGDKFGAHIECCKGSFVHAQKQLPERSPAATALRRGEWLSVKRYRPTVVGCGVEVVLFR
jgi:hypothetical protein